MLSSLELSAKRGIVGGLGLFGLAVLLAPIDAAREDSTVTAWLALAIHVAGPLLAVAAMSSWRRWRHLRPDTRVGLLIASAFAFPTLAFVAMRGENLPGSMLVSLILALSTAALWWVVRGQRLDATPPT
jgi:L-lactate permease